MEKQPCLQDILSLSHEKYNQELSLIVKICQSLFPLYNSYFCIEICS